MKRLFLLITFLSLSLSSCEDYLNVKPSNVVAIVSYDEVKALLGGHLRMFAEAPSTILKGTTVPYCEKDVWTFFNMLSDDIDSEKYMSTSIGGNNKALYKLTANWRNFETPGIIWKNLYANIGFYNTILDELSKVEATKAQSDIISCEVRVLRAWNLFKLMQYFSPYHNAKLGIPVNLDAQMVGEYDGTRKTQAEVYNIIIKELTDVLASTTEPRETYNLFFDKTIVNALLAQVYHFKGGSAAGQSGDYDSAIRHAKAAMGERQLRPLEGYEPFHHFEEAPGVKKKYPYSIFYDNRSDYVISNIVGSTYQKIPAPASLFDLYSDKDVRKVNFFDANKNIIKYSQVFPLSSTWTTFSVYTFWSVAEMHLIIAESYARKGDNTGAKEWLESFQRNRIANYTSFTEGDLLQEILKERRREFCYEYDMRWCDLVRTQKGWSRPSYDDKEVATYSLEDGDYRFCLPIPSAEEMQWNNKIEQNPGWGIEN